MDFCGAVGSDGLMGSSSSNGGGGGGGIFASILASLDSDPNKQRVLFGSNHLKHGRSGAPDEHEWRSLKVGRTNSHSLFPDGEQMLSFSSNAAASPYYHHLSSPSYARNPDLVYGIPNGSMHGFLGGARGPFTPSQLMELKHQALIYTYIDAKMPIPSSLLNSIRRDYNPSVFSAFSAGSYGLANTLGWGSFHLGFSGNADPEPGRCRRTDGKKWRCSRDAVVEQKYCERHMNRGRHRSRKHVEVQNEYAVKAIPVAAPSQSALPASGGRSTDTLMKNLEPNLTDSSSAQYNRMNENKESVNGRVSNSQSLAMLATGNTKPMSTLFPISKHALEGTTGTDFGFIPTDSLLNLHSEKSSFRHFIDDWPKDHSDRSSLAWPEVTLPDRTQLSISIPLTSDFSSSSSSPNQGKLSLSPLRMSKEMDPIHMGLGVGGVANEVAPRQASWVPITWESSLGGPLGEVLANTNSTPRDRSKNYSSSSLNLLTDGWDTSPRLQSSPNDVLHNATFASLSSSTGSSPRAENYKANDSTSSLREATFVNSSTILYYKKKYNFRERSVEYQRSVKGMSQWLWRQF